MSKNPAPRPWEELDADTQTALLVEFGRHQDAWPLTCDPTVKAGRFARWLAGRGVTWGGEPGRASGAGPGGDRPDP